jgi:hypothetical protein
VVLATMTLPLEQATIRVYTRQPETSDSMTLLARVMTCTSDDSIVRGRSQRGVIETPQPERGATVVRSPPSSGRADAMIPTAGGTCPAQVRHVPCARARIPCPPGLSRRALPNAGRGTKDAYEQRHHLEAPTMTTTANIVLYGSGLFGRDVPLTNATQGAALAESGFTTVILWTLHVDPDGTLVYNDTVIVRDGVFAATFLYLPRLVNQLKTAPGSSVKTVLFCVGSGGVDDFKNIQSLLATKAGKLTLSRNFHALSAALPIDGFDFDDEDLFDPTTTAQLTELLCAGNEMIITYCPYFGEATPWNAAIEAVYTWDQQQNPVLGQSVRWWNLQCYSGGGSNVPATWVQQLSTKAGIGDAAAYIIPGYDASVQTPSSIQATFTALAASDPGIAGGFIWNSSAIFASTSTPKDYAQAILAGLAAGTKKARRANVEPMSNPNSVLYVYGVFDSGEKSTWSSFPGYIQDITTSQFNVVVFSTFHVQASGDLYGSVPLVTAGVFNPEQQLDPCLPQLYQSLQAAGLTLLYSIGNASGSNGDLAALGTILADPGGAAYLNLQQNMKVLSSTLSISGIDFDFEPDDYSPGIAQVVAQFTSFCNDLGLTVTYCPFTNESWWIETQIAAVESGGSVAWWNLQCYAGGGGNTPAAWEPSITAKAAAMGVTDVATFLVPGIDTTGGPAVVQAAVSGWASAAPGLNGAFVWQLGTIEGTPDSVSQYAEAVVTGLTNQGASRQG